MLDPELIPVFNTTDETIPPGGLVRTFDVNTDTGHSLGKKPDADNDPAVCVNGPLSIPPKSVGTCSFYTRGIVAYDDTDGAPSVGESWGVKAGSWLLRKDYSGFAPLSAGIDGLVNAVRVNPIPAVGREPSAAVLSESTGPASGILRGINGTFTWADVGPAQTDSIYPVELEGAPFPAKPTANGIIWLSRQPGPTWEFLPVQTADATHPGYVSITTQTFAGFKILPDGGGVSFLTVGTLLGPPAVTGVGVGVYVEGLSYIAAPIASVGGAYIAFSNVGTMGNPATAEYAALGSTYLNFHMFVGSWTTATMRPYAPGGGLAVMDFVVDALSINHQIGATASPFGFVFVGGVYMSGTGPTVIDGGTW